MRAPRGISEWVNLLLIIGVAIYLSAGAARHVGLWP